MSGLPLHVQERIGGLLTEIGLFFKPGAKLTLLVRPNLGPDKDGDVVMTNDDLPSAIAALQRRHELEGKQP